MLPGQIAPSPEAGLPDGDGVGPPSRARREAEPEPDEGRASQDDAAEVQLVVGPLSSDGDLPGSAVGGQSALAEDLALGLVEGEVQPPRHLPRQGEGPDSCDVGSPRPERRGPPLAG